MNKEKIINNNKIYYKEHKEDKLNYHKDYYIKNKNDLNYKKKRKNKEIPIIMEHKDITLYFN